MIDILADAWNHPDRKAFYYSAAGKPTASERLNAMPLWDWTPQPMARPSKASTCMFPLALGCPPAFTSEGKEWIEPLIADPAQVDDFTAPPVTEGRTGEVLEEIDRLVAEGGDDLRIVDPDTQSPLGVAELMWDDSFYIALVEHPEAVHTLLDKIADFIVEFVKEVQRRAGSQLNACGFPPVWSPSGGTMVADDTMSLISPAMHREFSVPYLNRMAERCGPLYYHSCSWRAPYYDNIREIAHCRSYNWNPGNSADPAELIGEFSGEAVLALHLVKDMHRDNDVLALGKDFEDECAFLRYWIDAMRDDTCLYVWFSNIIQKPGQIEKIYDMLDEMGYTPAARGLTQGHP